MAAAYGWLLTSVSHDSVLTLAAFQKAGVVGVVGIVIAIILSCFLKETGGAIKNQPNAANSTPVTSPTSIVEH